MIAHPDCHEVHVCQEPSGRTCIESGCAVPAGTLWGPYWCPDHDRDRIDRISGQLEQINEQFGRTDK